MKIGYARVSTEEQNLDLQITALKAAGCDVLHKDHGISGASLFRPGLRAALAAAHAGDVIVVWRLDRLGRSLTHLVSVIEELGERGIQFASLTEYIDTRSSGGMLMFHMMAALAQFERSLISERTRAGVAAARQRGVRLGRPKSVTDAQVARARDLLQHMHFGQVAEMLSLHPTTLQRHLKNHPVARCDMPYPGLVGACGLSDSRRLGAGTPFTILSPDQESSARRPQIENSPTAFADLRNHRTRFSRLARK